MQNVFFTGERRTGKSTFIHAFLKGLDLDYVGIFSLRLMRDEKISGYGLRFGNEPEVCIFAELSDTPDFDRFRIDLRVFEKAAEFIYNNLKNPPDLFVVDELGVIEQRCTAYCDAIKELLSSPLKTCLVVQQRALPFWQALCPNCAIEILYWQEANRQLVSERLKALLCGSQ
ncbi:MAG: nucleoside-triphosphatase [candidate division KSB1 bacterium]|nr:nucleoside-triphosphatase [candidate division KSB1 bacterium]